MRWVFAAALIYFLALGSSLRAADQTPATPQTSNALPASRSGADIYGAACATCHARDGRGAAQQQLGFEAIPRDFTDCTTTAEPTPDWFAVVHEGGPIRALDRHMPAFGSALTADDINKVVDYLRSFCDGHDRWPLGDLNFPRAFFTEKAFPENESVWTSDIRTHLITSIATDFIYEKRLGARSQFEVVVPIEATQNREVDQHPWVRGIGDVAFAFKHAFLVSNRTGTIAAAGAEVALPTGNYLKEIGNGYTLYEPFAMFGQVLPRNSFFEMHGGVELPGDWRGQKESYLRTAIGTTFAQDRGFGRAWTPIVEVLYAKPWGEPSEYEVVPQIQVSLSKLQHVLVSAGVSVPVNKRDTRYERYLVGIVWDWFDGPFFSFWK